VKKKSHLLRPPTKFIAMSLTVGVLALQGGFHEHLVLLRQAAQHLTSSTSTTSFDFIEVRTSEQLARCDALIIPGGESTTISLVAAQTDLLDKLRDFVKYVTTAALQSRLHMLTPFLPEFRRNPPGAPAPASSSSPSRPTPPRKAARSLSAAWACASTATTSADRLRASRQI
jgi:hypothetical protein